MSINNRHRLLQKLIDGNITAEERFSLEKEALDDSLLFEAIEGLSESSANHNDHIESIISKIKKQQQEKKVLRLIWPIAAAASLLLLFTVGIMLTQESDSTTLNEQNPIAALEDKGTENDYNKIADGEERSPQNNNVLTNEEESLNNNPNASALSSTSISPNVIKEETKKTSSPIVVFPTEEVEPVEDIAFSIELGNEVEENNSEEAVVESGEEPPSTTSAETSRKLQPPPLNLNRAERASAISTDSEGLAKRKKSIMADSDLVFDSQPELTIHISEKYNLIFSEKLEVQGLEFLITLLDGKDVTKVEQISGDIDLGAKIIPFIKEYKEWKLLNRKGELQFTYIYNSK